MTTSGFFWSLEPFPGFSQTIGQINLWDDGRTVPDTIQALFEFPRGVHLVYHATLTSSFDNAYEMYHGNDSTIMMRDSKAWMFKEVDAPMLGWEVYARKDTFYKEQGVALVADATKLAAQGLDPAADDPNVETSLFMATDQVASGSEKRPRCKIAPVVSFFNPNHPRCLAVEVARFLNPLRVLPCLE